MMSRPDSPVLRLAATSLATGVATALLPPARLPAGVRRSLHAVMGLGAGGAMLLALARPGAGAADGAAADLADGAPADPTDAEPLPVAARIGVAAAVGTMVTLISVGGGVLDAKAERALRRRGVRHPRLWIGAAAAALSAVSALVEDHLDSGDVGDPA